MSLPSASRMSALPIRGSLCRAIAYAFGLRLIDDRTGVVYDFTRRRRPGREDVLRTESFVPANDLSSIGAFCNRVQRRNKHKRPIYGRRLIVALVKEATFEANWAALVDFAKRIRDRYGVGVMIAMHGERVEAVTDEQGIRHEVGNGNVHAHVYLTYCAVDEEGGLGNKVADLDPIACSRAHRPNLCRILRPMWTQCINEQLEGEGMTGRVDLRSLADRGIDETPTVPLGPWSSALERDGEKTMLGNVNRQIKVRNASRRRLIKHVDRLTECQDVLQQAVEFERTRGGLTISRNSMKRLWLVAANSGRVQFVSRRHGVIAMRDEGRLVLVGNQVMTVDPGRKHFAKSFLEAIFGSQDGQLISAAVPTKAPTDDRWLPSLPTSADGRVLYAPKQGDAARDSLRKLDLAPKLDQQ